MESIKCHERRSCTVFDYSLGYFKKRKCSASNFKPPEEEMKQHNKRTHIKQIRFFKEYLSSSYVKKLIFLPLILNIAFANATTTIEPSLSVLSLWTQSTTTSPSGLTSNSEILNNNSHVCQTIEVREDPEALKSLRGCRVVEGSLSILNLDEFNSTDSFPELVEITGYLLIYRLFGVRSLKDLFPNLAIIRGKNLFQHYALVLYEMENLEEVGLTNLQIIQRGSVRIEKNAKLCFANTIDWKSIAIQEGYEEYIGKNQRAAHCGQCPGPKNAKPEFAKNCKINSKNKDRFHCWNKDSCQRECIDKNDKACSPSGKKCHESCIGGCDDDNPNQCFACNSIDIGKEKAICTEKCPDDLYKYENKRCVTAEVCRKFIPKEDQRHFIPFQRVCQPGCPVDHTETIDNVTGFQTCRYCGTTCKKICKIARVIDSVSSAQLFTGCYIIEGNLEINIKAGTKNIVKELEIALEHIQEITGFLKVVRSSSIVSLSFLKNLKIIHGHHLDNEKFSVYIWDNFNLQSLFNEGQNVEVAKGHFQIYLNPKLCYNLIKDFVKDESRIEDLKATKNTNGDKNSCNTIELEVRVETLSSNHALLDWKKLALADNRKLLNYVVYYMPTDENVTIWDSREACGADGWKDDDVFESSTNDTVSYPIFHLQPFTRYAFYVQAFIIETENINALSEVKYFRTKPGQPAPIPSKKFTVTVHNSSSITITWEKPKQINGKFDKYILKLKTEEFSDILFTSERDYCSHPIEHWELEEEKKTSKEDTTISKDPNLSQTCDCKESCRKVCDEIDKDDGTTRENAIFFENQIQDFVWKKQEDMKPIAVENFNNRKAKRQADIFPGSSADKETVKIKKDPLDESDETMTLNSYGEYENIRIPINNETNTSITITNLRHFTRYQVHIHVCRQLDESEDPNMNIELCSDPTVEFIRTSKDEGKDDITWFQVEEIASNVSAYGALKVSWIIPKRPNGAVTAYNFRYKRNDAEHSKATDKCINEDQFRRLYFNKNENKGTYIIKQVNPGNYSVQLWASSLAGSPQVTANFPVPKYVLISEKSESDYTLHILIGVLIILVMFVCAALFIINKRNQNISRNLKLIANVNPDYAGVDYQLDDWEIPRDRIILLHELGQGSFGMVYEGIVKDLVRRSGDEKIEGETPCAVKTVNENATDRERSSFLSEATVMKQFDTAFVVKLLGVVSVSQPTYVVMELMPNGDLKGYLRLHRAEYNDDTPQPPPQPPTIRQMLQMSAEIADGMSYLAAKKFVHRDLAARNCMVAADLTVKIGDFGMTRDIYETDYYRKGTKGLLPVRWMSPESLKDGVFSTASDVFSYGVVLWEIATLASQPYQGFSNDQTLRYVIEGGVMERPENCPDRLYEIMRRCWQHRPSARPSFLEIIDSLRDAVNDNFRNVSYFYSKEGQDLFNQQRNQQDFSIQMTDDVTTPLTLRNEDDDDQMTSSVGGNNFLMHDLSEERSRKLHDL